jgi:glycine hydroxymethyltransferase
MLVDLRSKELSGKEAEELLEKEGITVNMNLIPFDPAKPTVTSGIRIGLAGVTSRGFTSEDSAAVAAMTADILEKKPSGEKTYRERVLELCLRYPLYMTRQELAASPFLTQDVL